MTRERARQVIDVGLRVLAGGLMLSLCVACWHDTSKAWDVWYYHLPFAARIVGLAGASGTSFTFGALNEARFDGFPLFGELVQGVLWRLTGKPECASFASLAALPALAWLLARLFKVPLHLTVLALLAIPLVQIHATAAYVDLPANAEVAMLALLAYRQVVAREAPSVRALLLGSVLAVAAANTKFQLVPVVLAAAAVLVVTALRRDTRRRARLVVIALALPFVLATPIKNTIRHGNPVWPVELHVLGKTLPHNEGAYASSPDWLENVPRPLRWGASVLELGLHPIASHERWSIDQWTPPSEPGYRMGGFFGAYAIVNVVALAWAAFVRRTRETKVAAMFAAGASIIACMLPQSHELRYYLFWMLLLVALNLVVWSRERRLTTSVVAIAALAVVTWSTGGTYLYASGDSFATLLHDKVDRAALERIEPGERVCIMRQPWTFLYAPRFHPEKRYSVQEAADVVECGDARLLE